MLSPYRFIFFLERIRKIVHNSALSLTKKNNMKFAIDSNHREFFQKNKAIEFEGLLSEEHLLEMRKHIESVLCARMGISPQKLSKESSENIFMAGRDLWRDDTTLRKLMTRRQLAEIASELVEQRPIKLGYDQYFHSSLTQNQFVKSKKTPYEVMQTQPSNLTDLSSIRGVLCGLMICMESPTDTFHKDDLSLFCNKPGNGVFFAPDAVIDFTEFNDKPGYSYLLIVYGESSIYYILQDNDLLTHQYKHIGYIYGDKLTEKTHPTIIR